MDLISVGVQVLGFAATAGVISAVLSHVLSRRIEERKTRRENAYTAIRLAVIFEQYSSACADIIIQNEQSEMNKGRSVKPTTVLAQLGVLPQDDSGWRGLTSEIAADVLSFPLRVKLAEEIVQSAFVHAEESDAVRETTDQAVILGSMAWKLAERLRKEHGFRAFQPEFPFQKVFLDELDPVVQRRRTFGSTIEVA